MNDRFSRRQGYSEQEAEITLRHEAPEELRYVVVEIADEAGLSPSTLRSIICRVLRKAPDQNNWSVSNIKSELKEHIRACEWYQVYDVIEEIHSFLSLGGALTLKHRSSEDAAEYFADEINRYFFVRGIGWQLLDGQIVVRGAEAFEEVIQGARTLLTEVGSNTASRELHEAVLDLSRRPTPDVTGAIQHAMAALECVARKASGDSKATLGDLIRRTPDIFPKPLDQALEKAWGFASETGRHLKEGKEPDFEEAELMVAISGALCRYLGQKIATP